MSKLLSADFFPPLLSPSPSFFLLWTHDEVEKKRKEGNYKEEIRFSREKKRKNGIDKENEKKLYVCPII